MHIFIFTRGWYSCCNFQQHSRITSPPKQNCTKLVKLSLVNLFCFLDQSTQTCSLYFTDNYLRTTIDEQSTEQAPHRTRESLTKSQTRKILSLNTLCRADTVVSLVGNNKVRSFSVFTRYHAASFSVFRNVAPGFDFRESRPCRSVNQRVKEMHDEPSRSKLTESFKDPHGTSAVPRMTDYAWAFRSFSLLSDSERVTRGDERVLRVPRSFCSNGFLMRHRYTTDLSTHVNRFTRGTPSVPTSPTTTRPTRRCSSCLRTYVPRSFCTLREHPTTRCFLRLSLFRFCSRFDTDSCWRKFTPSELKIRCETNGSFLVLILSRIDDEVYAELTIWKLRNA